MRRTAVGLKKLLGLACIVFWTLSLISLTFRCKKEKDNVILAPRVKRNLSPSLRIPINSTTKNLIPRIIHQTYKTRHLTQQHQLAVHSWKLNNPLWEYRFYDNTACQAFVALNYPQWLSAYLALPLAVEQADFFRYMVVLKHGGVYADVDTQCASSLDSIIMPTDSLLTGWEDEYATAELAVMSNFARQRQLQQWIFAAEPGHPALQALCERVATSAFHPYSNSITDALFRTGPGPFTDEVLNHAMRRNQNSRYNIRMLPRVTLGGLPGGEHGVGLWQEPARLVVHLHMGSWKSPSFKRKARLLMDEQRAMALLHAPSKAELQLKLYPVSTATEPPFTIMTPLKGQSNHQGAADVASEITTWGYPLPPGEYLMKQPIFKAFFEAWQDLHGVGQGFLDVGAGLGFYTLAAAAAGRHVEAYVAGNHDLMFLEASIEYNGFSNRIALHKVNVLQPSPRQDQRGSWTSHLPEIGKKPSSPLSPCMTAAANISAAILNRLKSDHPSANGDSFGAVRIGMYGLEDLVLQTLKVHLQKPTLQVILLEVFPRLLSCPGRSRGIEEILGWLKDLGFKEILHMGTVCMRIQTKVVWIQRPLESILSQVSGRARRSLEQHVVIEPDFQWCSFEWTAFKAEIKHLPTPSMPEIFLISKPS